MVIFVLGDHVTCSRDQILYTFNQGFHIRKAKFPYELGWNLAQFGPTDDRIIYEQVFVFMRDHGQFRRIPRILQLSLWNQISASNWEH